jgi:CubicO group peptidase (beta-lactamase class C family)
MIGVTFAHHANEPYCFDCMHKYKIGDKTNENYHVFESDLQDNELSKIADEQIKNKASGLVSYLLWKNNKILVDQNRKSKYRKGYYPSHSVGKSLVGLVTGYALCEGYINHTVFDRIDYPTVADTLYENQKLINLLNMQAGDDAIIGDRIYGKDNPIKGKSPNTNTIPIKKVMKKYFKDKQHLGLEPGLNFNYSALTTNVVMNYVIYKTGDDWEKLLHKVFVEDAKVEKRVYFGKTLNKNKVGNRKSGEYGRYSFYAQRYDYLRIAKLVLDHWNNDTCVGKYLKTMYENRVDRQYEYSKFRGNHNAAQTYGGQFLFDPIGIEDRPILMMDGAYGQQIVIDFNNNRIITAHSTDRHYDYYSLIYLQLSQDLSHNPDDRQSKRKKCRKYINAEQFVLEPC